MAREYKNSKNPGLGQSLIPAISKLQDILSQLGSESVIDLPQVAVVGSQSSGKSSVLEALVGRDFLPRGLDICTRRPLVLQLVQIPQSVDNELVYDEWGEFLHLPGQRFTDFSAIRREIQDEGENIDIKKEDILVSSIPQPFDEVARMMVCYVTLEGRFSSIPMHHLVLLNHFRREVKGKEFFVEDSPSTVLPVMEQDISPVLEKKFNMQAETVKTIEDNVDFLLKSAVKEQASDPIPGLKEEIATLESKLKDLEDKHNNCLTMHSAILDLMQVHICQICLCMEEWQDCQKTARKCLVPPCTRPDMYDYGL
ncbi:hypothetical protein KI387_007975, partial [Taxus chinensis]